MSEPVQPAVDDLPESHLYTFIDEAREFAIYFLEGQRLIRELALVHHLQGAGFNYYRDVVLSVQPMIAFLKGGEQCGFCIDSEKPYFRLKIETGHNGQTRSMLVPEDLRDFPESMDGIVRVQKLFPRNRPPYQSILRIPGLPLREIVNLVLRDSYQSNSAILLSSSSDQSMLLHQLPPLKDEYDYSLDAVRSLRERLQQDLTALFDRALTDRDSIVAGFADLGFRLLASRPVRFHCSCSHDRVLAGISSIYRKEGDNLFAPGKNWLDVTCEYCKKEYRIDRGELGDSANPVN